MEEPGVSCCQRCIQFLISIGFIALSLWLSLRVDEPKCYIENIYVPALNNSHSNTTLFFKLKLVNENKIKGIQYDDVHLFFKVFVNVNTTPALGNATVPRFYQGFHKKAHKEGSLVAAAGSNLTADVDGKVVYRVDYLTAVKYKVVFWYTKRHRLWGGANVEMNNSGLKVQTKPVRLSGTSLPVIQSGAPELRGCYRALVSFFCLVALLVIY